MKKANPLYLLVLGLILCSFQCSKDDTLEEEKQTLIGWYMRDLENIPDQSDFNVINEAIYNGEVLKSYSSGDVVASYGLFIDSEGRYSDSAAKFGRLRFAIPSIVNAIQIVDENTLRFYVGSLYVVRANVRQDMLYKLYAGPVFGHMAYYGTGTYYTYTKVDNKLIVSDGNIYTVVDGKLVKDGGSVPFTKYDPTMVH